VLLGGGGETLQAWALPSLVPTEDGCASPRKSPELRVGVAGGRKGVAFSELSSVKVTSVAHWRGERDREAFRI